MIVRYAIAVTALVFAVGIALAVGPYFIGVTEVVSAIVNKLIGGAVPEMIDTVLFRIRMPRVAAGLLAGGALAVAGTTYQSMFRNPLVSPDVLGVSAGASLGAVFGIVMHMPIPVIQALSFAGGLLAVMAAYTMGAVFRTRDPVLVLVLAGVAIGALLSAGLSLLKILADPYNQLPTITYWLLGSLASTTSHDLVWMAPAVLMGLVPLVLLRWRVNVLSLGDDEARTLGVNVARVRMLVVGAATLMTAATVATCGVIGWVGLVVPHLARALVGPDFSKLAPVALLLGAAFLVLVDTAARSVASIEVPLGVLTAFCGAPFFVWALASARRGWS
ncbi:MAG: iron ABC transporter permease [Clostridia bacterium]|nr:iron ABC transporter permease [Deltaproteobacteria bacterium]